MTKAINPAPLPGRRQVLFGLAASALAACTNPPGTPVVTRSEKDPDPLARFRVLADAGSEAWAQHLRPPQSSEGPTVLALSGGGEDGAFGAGALVGWSANGQRPEFDLVTGTSTGALIAPFAFLGPDHDEDLRQIFTEHEASDIMRLSLVSAAMSDALYDTEPLAKLINDYTPDPFLQAVAARHATGARLLVVTSELDTARAYAWDMGAVAQSGEYDLFRAILRASSALPGLFPPVELSYLSGGTTYQETHIDGGVHMQFLAIPSFAFTSSDQGLPGGELYVLINNTLNPAPASVPRSALGISQQALTTMARASALSGVKATQLFARENGLDLSFASINPESGIVYDPSDRFSQTYMNALFRHGYERATGGTLWTAG